MKRPPSRRPFWDFIYLLTPSQQTIGERDRGTYRPLLEVLEDRTAPTAVPFFTPPSISDTADGAYSVATADLDGDGDLDVLSASFHDDKIAWYENDGGAVPSFALHTISTSADGAYSVSVADVDGDGDFDVLSASFNDDKIAWYDNNGAADPVFTLRTISLTADGATSVNAVDLDGDGDKDILSASVLDDKIAWYENDGATTPAFTLHTINLSARAAISATALDLDGDGDTDVLTASIDDDTIAWYENDGAADPTFTLHTITTSADAAFSVTAADLDDDGDVDVLSASALDDTIAWYENDGAATPTFKLRIISISAAFARSVTTADLDSDGDLDVLSASSTDDKIAWYENDGAADPTFTLRTISTFADGAFAVTAADVDGDGDLDVLSASANDDRIAWSRNDTIHRNADFSQKTVISNTANRVLSLTAADVDGDGDIDLLSASFEDDKITWYQNDGATVPSFMPHTISTTADGAYSVTGADLDGDGDTDVLSASMNGNLVAWYENDGATIPTFILRTISTTADGARSVTTGDLDGDGDLDVLSASYRDEKIAWYENDGAVTPTFSLRTISTSDSAISVTAADLDGDGDLDVLSTTSSDDKIVWYESDGGTIPTFAQHTIDTTADGAISALAVDLDGDGDLDVLSPIIGGNKIVWYENNGAAVPTFLLHTIATALIGVISVSAEDLDGDGDIDLVSASYFDNQIAWFENDGAAVPAFSLRTISTTAFRARATAVADLDGDGRPDVVSASVTDDTIAWYGNRGGQFALEPVAGPTVALADDALDDVLKIVLKHNGRVGDNALELTGLDLLFEASPGNPLTVEEFNNLFDRFAVYRDTNANGTLEPGADTQVLLFSVVTGNDGRVGLSFLDDDVNVQVAFGTPATFFVAVKMEADASLQTPNAFRITAEPSSVGFVEDVLDTPLRPQETPVFLSRTLHALNPVLTATGSDKGPGNVTVFDAVTGRLIASFSAYPGFDAGARVAMADVNGDAIPDVITAPGKKMPAGAVVKAFDGDALLLDLAVELFDFRPYGSSHSEVFVSAADFNNDNLADIVTSNVAKGPTVKVFDAGDFEFPAPVDVLANIQPFGSAYKGGIRVAVGDVNGDGTPDLIAGQSKNGAQVRVISGVDFTTVLMKTTIATPLISGGVFVAAGNVDGDNRIDVIVGLGAGTTSKVFVYEDAKDTNTNAQLLKSRKPIYGTTFMGGVRVAAVDVDGDGDGDILTTAGAGLNPYRLRVLDGLTLTALDSFFSQAPDFIDARFVAAARLG